MAQSPGQYFVHVFTLFISSMAMTNMFRMFGNITPSLYIAQQVLTFILILMICYSGYLIPHPKMHPWLSWFYWINPFAYAFKGLFSNEMRNLRFDCSGTGSIPAGPGYDDPAYQTCTLPGSTPGADYVVGRSYLQRAYDINVDDQAIDVIAVFLFWILFTVINMAAMEWLDFTGGGYTHKVYKRGKAPKENTNESEKEAQLLVQQATDSMSKTLTLKGGCFMWKDVRYTVPVKGGDRLLLDDVEGWIKPGQMTALMGASGAGKTTLLDVLAKRKTMGTVSGTVTLNGKPLKIDFERITGYVEQ
ncbi:ABC transporter G family protein, partial [Planoprotostelium fungivorum]